MPKSKYVPCDYGIVQPTFSPSQMDISAYTNWLSKLCRPKGRHMTSTEYARALEILHTEFDPFVVGGLSSVEEVLVDIDWDKSPGWPYVNEGCTTKREAWEQQSDVIIDRANRLIAGEYVECLFIATPKDELLPPGKSARIFLPSPFHHQLACAMLFKRAADSLKDTCHYHASAIGINIFGSGLERSLRQLSALPFGYDADQSGCDTSWKNAEPERDFMKTGLPHSVHAGVDLVVNLAMCPRVIVVDRILQIEMNPSGWYLTTVFNTLMTHRSVAGAYLDLAPQPETIDEMRTHLKQLNGGDDLAYSTDRGWFGISALANNLASRGLYLESDVLEPRNALSLTFFSHQLMERFVDSTQSKIIVAGGRMSKMLSAFSFLKKHDGSIDYQRNAARVVGLMMNLWAYKATYDAVYPYLYHLLHHFYYLAGFPATSEWTGVFRSIPTDERMLALRSGHARREGLLFSLPTFQTSAHEVKLRTTSGLKSGMQATPSRTLQSMTKNAQTKPTPKKQGRRAPQAIVRSIAKNQAQETPPAANAIAASHAPPQPTKTKWHKGMDRFSGWVEKAGKWLASDGLETLITLGSSLLGSPAIIAQRDEINRRLLARDSSAHVFDDSTIPAGTVLAQIPIAPNFAESLTPEQGQGETRLATKAKIFLKYKFTNTCVDFQPAAGALNNGQIGFFVTSDPRYELTATGADAVRLVREFKGVSTNISQPATLKVPEIKDSLFVSDAHESDTRFTEQGMLWIIAFTDLVLASDASSGTGTTSSLGEFVLRYNIDLKDDSVDNAIITPIYNQPCLVATTSGTVPGTPNFTSGVRVGSINLDQRDLPMSVVLDVDNLGFVTQGQSGVWTFNQAGFYKISVLLDLAGGCTGAPTSGLFTLYVNGVATNNVQASMTNSSLTYAFSGNAEFYLQLAVNDLINIQFAWQGASVLNTMIVNSASLAFTQLILIPGTVTAPQNLSMHSALKRGLKYTKKTPQVPRTIETTKNQRPSSPEWVNVPGAPDTQVHLSSGRLRLDPLRRSDL